LAVERSILHMDLDTFFVSVERLKDSSLNGKPVIVGGTSDRGVVASCSYEARKFGVHSAMPTRQAKKLCPEAIFVHGDHESYTKYSRMVTKILVDNAPVVEKASIDEHYLDLSGMEKYFGCLKVASELRQRVIRETGLPISFGLSSGRTVSKVATGLAKPNGQLHVPHGTEKAFLAPLPIKKIPMAGEKTCERLAKAGLTLCGHVQQASSDYLVTLLGEHGLVIWKKCSGIDRARVDAYSERKSISKETTFHEDTADPEKLKRRITRLADEVAFELRRQKFLTSCITIKIRNSDFHTEQLQQKMAYTSSTERITQKVLELYNRLYTGRVNLRLVGVKCSDLVHGVEQPDLFDEVATLTSLNSAMDDIRTRFGSKLVTRAGCIG
jgi:DNA polymerase IV